MSLFSNPERLWSVFIFWAVVLTGVLSPRIASTDANGWLLVGDTSPPHVTTPVSSSQIDSSAPEKSTAEPRGCHLGPKFRESDLVEAYRLVQRDYQEKAFGARNRLSWKLLNEKDGVTVSMLQHPDDPSCPYVQMKAVMPVSVQDCWDFLRVDKWDESMPKMDPFYEGVDIYGEYTHKQAHMILCRKRMKRLLAFGKRDLVFLSVIDAPLDDGTWVSGTVSVHTDKIPRQSGYTRAFQDSIAFYKPLSDGSTALTIICRIDLNDSSPKGSGGFIPMWLYVKTIGTTATQSVSRMRDALVEAQQGKAAASSEQPARTPWLNKFRASIRRQQLERIHGE